MNLATVLLRHCVCDSIETNTNAGIPQVTTREGGMMLAIIKDTGTIPEILSYYRLCFPNTIYPVKSGV
jgi:hypothetical protein